MRNADRRNGTWYPPWQHGVDHWRATCIERCPRGSEGSHAGQGLHPRYLTAWLTRWKAAWSLHAEGDPAAEIWVRRHANDILNGKARNTAANIRSAATRAGLGRDERAGADKCATYLTNKHRYLNYPKALKQGWPIATGVIEGACRHLVKDRMDITGARWGLTGAEAILKLRAIHSNGDWDQYWTYHLSQEQHRIHETRYANNVIPRAA